MVPHNVQLQVRRAGRNSLYPSVLTPDRFPLEVVFRIYDNVLASGIEALFSFSLMLLYKNEETLLQMKFDQLLVFLNTRMLEVYQVQSVFSALSVFNRDLLQVDPPESDDPKTATYDVDQFVQDAISMNITPFTLDQYATEYEELVRTRDAHAIEMDALRNSNRNLSTQV